MTNIQDSLSTFTNQLSSALSGYRDRPFYGLVSSGFASIYKTSWLARTAVDRIPDDCFKKGYQWVAEADQISKIEAVERRHKIREKKLKALKLARRDGEGYLYMDDGHPTETEFDPATVRLNGLRFVNVFRRDQLTAGPLIRDPVSPYFEQPEYYQISSDSRGMVRVHPSRVIRFVNDLDYEQGFGESVLIRMLDPICRAEKSAENVSALTGQARVWVMKSDDLSAAMQDEGLAQKVVQRYLMFQQMLETNRLAVIDKEHEDLDQQTTSFATLPDVIETMRREVAAALEIPYALLFGRAGGLGTNGDMDLANYYDNIATMQRNDIEPVCAPLDEAVIRSALGDLPEEIYLEWLSLWEMSAKEKAEIGKLIADTVNVLVQSGVVPPDVLTEPTINELVENGSLQGLEQSYKDWKAGGGVLEEPDDESDVIGRAEDDPAA